MTLIKFQQITKVYRLTKSENDFLKLIPATYKKAWDGKLSDLIANGTLSANAAATRNQIKKRIKEKLLSIQDSYCIYCGIHFEIVGTAQREHIAHKDKYPQFTFTNKNIALACAYCNGFEKKSTKNVLSTLRTSYANCDFSIVHPYFDNIEDHIELTFDGANISLSEKNNSAKGKSTISIFKLMEAAQAAMRGGAYLREKELQKLSSSSIKKRNAVVIKKYTF